MSTKNYILILGGSVILVYANTLTIDEVVQFAETASKKSVEDCYEVKDEELQYYCIDDRVWIDTPEKEEKVRVIINAK